MMPPYPPPQQQQSTLNINEQIRYLEKMMEMKNQENRKLMKMLMDTKRIKDKPQAKERLSQIHESRVSAVK